MTEESVTHTADATDTPSAEPADNEEGGARGILRDAIHKVMEEIEHHEKEAKHHLERATELRKALRESISFLQEQGEKRVPSGLARSSRATVVGAPVVRERPEKSTSSNAQKRPKKK